MKTFFIILVFSTLFLGCSNKNAYVRFDMTKEQEKSVDSLVTSKIKNGNDVNGVVSVVYLNSVLPLSFHNEEHFYVYFYLKEKSFAPMFLLNETEAISAKKLPNPNEFTSLTSTTTQWNSYYHVTFKKQKNLLKFMLKSGPFSSNQLVFEKDE